MRAAGKSDAAPRNEVALTKAGAERSEDEQAAEADRAVARQSDQHPHADERPP